MQAPSNPSQLTFLLYILQRRIIWKKSLGFKKHKLGSENCASSRGRHSCYYGAEAEESLHKECADLWSRALRQPGLLLSSGTWLHPCPEAEKTDSAVHPSPAHQALPDGCHHVPRQVPHLGTWHSKGTPECRCPPGETEATGNFRDALTFIRCQYLAFTLGAEPRLCRAPIAAPMIHQLHKLWGISCAGAWGEGIGMMLAQHSMLARKWTAAKRLLIVCRNGWTVSFTHMQTLEVLQVSGNFSQK